MPRYQYAGQHPVPDGHGGVIRPGDILDAEPGFGPWTELPDGDGGPESAAEVPAAPVPAAERQQAVTASTAPPGAVPARTDPES